MNIKTQKSSRKLLSLKLVSIATSILQRRLAVLRGVFLPYNMSTVCPQVNVAAEVRRTLSDIGRRKRRFRHDMVPWRYEVVSLQRKHDFVNFHLCNLLPAKR